MENISSGGGGASSGSDGDAGSESGATVAGDAVHHHFYFDYGPGFAFDLDRLRTSISTSMTTISAHKIANAYADDTLAPASMWRYWSVISIYRYFLCESC